MQEKFLAVLVTSCFKRKNPPKISQAADVDDDERVRLRDVREKRGETRCSAAASKQRWML